MLGGQVDVNNRSRVAALADFDAVVTDWGLGAQEASELRAAGVDLIEARED